jgi:hypothetical protein
VGIANEDETKLAVTGYVRVSNNSGEQYDNAQTRLVVGKINLVEEIADLARRPTSGEWRNAPPDAGKAINDAFDSSIPHGEARHVYPVADLVIPIPVVIKQGLSGQFDANLGG